MANKNYQIIKKSLLYQHICNLNVLLDDIIIILIEYMAEYTEKLIYKFGEYGTTDDKITVPRGIAVYQNEIYVVDAGNYRIQVFDQKGNFIRKWGSYGNQDGQFLRALNILIIEDKVYITDYIKNQIQIFDLNGKFLKKWDNIISPLILITCNNLLYVLSYKTQQILVFNKEGVMVNKWGGTGKDAGKFNYAVCIATTNNIIYVADKFNNRIQVFDYKGNYIKEWEIDLPAKLTIVGENIYVYDMCNQIIQVFDLDGNFENTIAFKTERFFLYATNCYVDKNLIYSANNVCENAFQIFERVIDLPEQKNNLILNNLYSKIKSLLGYLN